MDEIDKIMTKAINEANFKYPQTPQGTTRDQIYVGEAAFYAEVARKELEEAGYQIIKL